LLSPPNTTAPLAALDSGASGHYLGITTATHLDNVSHDKDPITVHLPNATKLRSTHTAMLKLPQLPRAGKKVRLFRDTELTLPLLSVGQFCDADCTAHMDK
jgi:hypothetical protein